MHAQTLKELAITLRKNGYSYPYISKKTTLSKSTLSGWLADIPYTPNTETIKAHGKALAAAGERKAKIRQEALHQIKREAAEEIKSVTKRDLFMFGLGLYLGGGGKTHGFVRIVNSDPRVIKSIVAWFRNSGVHKTQFAVTIHLYPDTDIRQSLQFWSRTTSIPVNQFRKAQVDTRTDKKANKKGRLPYGTCHVSVQSKGRKEFGVSFFRKIQAWNDNVLEKVSKAGLV